MAARPAKRAYIAVINDLATDQRVQRVAALLQSEGMEVTCIGRRLKQHLEPAVTCTRSRRYRMLFNKGPLFYACFNTRLLFHFLFSGKPSLFVANDLDTLPAVYLASRVRRVPLIYDSHELFTQVPELINRPGIQGIWKWIERRIVPGLEHAVTVSNSIAEIYRRLYKTRFRVVRNVPFRKEPYPDPGIRDAYSGKKILIYQGALNVGRGLELVIDTMRYLENYVFIVAGTGDIKMELGKIVVEKELGDQVHFIGRIAPEALFPVTCAADVGISLEEDLGLNYRYALPNKLFDYIQARVPVLCSALPEIKYIVDTYRIGVSTKERDPEKLAMIVRNMCEQQGKRSWQDSLDRAAAELCWENESKIYLQLLEECGII